MTVKQLLKIINDDLSSGVLHECDEVTVLDPSGDKLYIISAECDTQSSDLNIIT
jgi:hypothetical protein